MWLRLYTLCSTVLALLALPLLPFFYWRPKYRQRILPRLGYGLSTRLGQHAPQGPGPCIWVHALSVGEVHSVAPLIQALRTTLPQARLVLSVSTQAGEQCARQSLHNEVEAIIAAPFDLRPVLKKFLRSIQPSLFIQVETDFWPNWLYCLRQQGIPRLLVNGRISARSFARYRRFHFLFAPMLGSFTLLCMHSRAELESMAQLGLKREQLRYLGNLKFDNLRCGDQPAQPKEKKALRRVYGLDAAAPLFICGSTHEGEEAPLLRLFVALRQTQPDLQLLLAPRNIERAASIKVLAKQEGLEFRCASSLEQAPRGNQGPLLLLDRMGELGRCYRMASIAFIGGSLEPCGGHNPIEAAGAAIPTFFGPHMEDFEEIAAGLVEQGGAVQGADSAALLPAMRRALHDRQAHHHMATAAFDYVVSQQGTVARHLELIKELL